jgi:hypothetical protein
MVKRTVGVALAALLLSAGIAEARPRLHDGYEGYKVRPAKILVSGDGSGVLGGAGFGDPPDYGTIRWEKFRRSGARGSGLMFINDCDPDCAGGMMHGSKAAIRAWRVRKGHYTRLSARYEQNGETTTTRWKLVVASPTHAYWLVR